MGEWVEWMGEWVEWLGEWVEWRVRGGVVVRGGVGE